MRFLLDSNVLIWSIEHALKPDVMNLLADRANELFVSRISLWEIAIKSGLGKLQIPEDLDEQLQALHMAALALEMSHIAAYRQLPLLHRDPFDRMLIAQAKVENLTIVTRDRRFAEYDVTVWPA